MAREHFFGKIMPIEERYPHHGIIPFEYTNIKRINDAHGRRWYSGVDPTHFNTISVPSVTTILDSEKSKSLEEWKKRVGADQAKRISDLAKDNGQEFHAACEAYLRDELMFPVGTSEFVMKMFRKVRPMLDKISEIQFLEEPLMCPTHAGTPDCIAKYEGIPAIIDFKTSKNGLHEDTKLKYFMQEYAYHRIWRYRYGQLAFDEPKIYVLIVGTSEVPEPQLFMTKAPKSMVSGRPAEIWDSKLLKFAQSIN